MEEGVCGHYIIYYSLHFTSPSIFNLLGVLSLNFSSFEIQRLLILGNSLLTIHFTSLYFTYSFYLSFLLPHCHYTSDALVYRHQELRPYFIHNPFFFTYLFYLLFVWSLPLHFSSYCDIINRIQGLGLRGILYSLHFTSSTLINSFCYLIDIINKLILGYREQDKGNTLLTISFTLLLFTSILFISLYSFCQVHWDIGIMDQGNSLMVITKLLLPLLSSFCQVH